MQRVKRIVVGVTLCMVVEAVTVGCEKEGPAEKAGKNADEALDAAKIKNNELTGEL